MLNLREAKRICIIGGGTAGWFSALFLRQIFNKNTEILLLSAPEIPIVGVGEGGVLNLMESLEQLDIPFIEFMKNTEAVHKLGFVYEGWRNNEKDEKDFYYHMFPLNRYKDLELKYGFIPALSILVNHQIPVSYVADSIRIREKNISQSDLTALFLNQRNKDFSSSFHFDAYKVGQYLKSIAIKRGVKYRPEEVKEISRDSVTGNVTLLHTAQEKYETDFVIDATGFSRLIVGHKLEGKWKSFKDTLTMNTAIPFHLKHSQKNPDLVTTATALSSGWVWQIPLQERIGAGYVFNRDYINESQAISEVETWLGHEIEPIRTIKFEAGVYEKVWLGNVMSLGLASGFVEPLEATSIGQMLEQLHYFRKIVVESDAVITQNLIDRFNSENLQAWSGIRDFIRMHYDTKRNDSPFWRELSRAASMSDHYQDLKSCWQYRTPRMFDLIPYHLGGRLQFGVYSWLAVAQAMGLVEGKASVVELLSLSSEEQNAVIKFSNDLQIKIKMA